MRRRFAILALAACTLAGPVRADWVPAGLEGHQIRALLQTPAGSRFASTGAGLLKSTDGGATWAAIQPQLFADAFAMVLGPDSSQVFLAVETGVYRSSDEGASWIFFGDPVNGTYSMAFAPNRDLYASGSSGTFRSSDRGLTWALVHEAPGSFTDGVAIDFEGRVFMKGIISHFERSDDRGATWLPMTPTEEYKTALAISPRTGTVLAASMNFLTPGLLSIWRSTDHGATWTRVAHREGGIDVIHFLRDGTALAGADVMLRSTDDGLTWQPFNDGMPFDAQFDCIAEIDGVVYASTRLEGLFREDALAVSVPTVSRASPAGFLLRAAPSPMRARGVLHFELPAAGEARLDLFGLRGERARVLAAGVHAAGPHAIRFETRGLAPGLWFARLTAGGRSETTPLVVLE